jgi:hypothetical protein
VVAGYNSSPQPLDISTIQGSLLGPVLFLIYINDFPNCTSLKSFLYTDDTTALKIGTNLTDLIHNVNNEIKKMSAWFKANKMSLNVSKTKYIIFYSKGKRVDMQNLTVFIDDNADPLNPDPSKIHTLDRVFTSNQNQCDRSFKLLACTLMKILFLMHRCLSSAINCPMLLHS